VAIGHLAEAYALVGPDEERRRFREALARLTSRELHGGHVSFTYHGTVLRLAGLLDASLGDLARAEEELRAAHALAVERQHAPWVAQIAYELAGVARRAGRDADARAFFMESARLARELGLSDLERRLGVAREAPDGPPDALPVALTKKGDVWTI